MHNQARPNWCWGMLPVLVVFGCGKVESHESAADVSSGGASSTATTAAGAGGSRAEGGSTTASSTMTTSSTTLGQAGASVDPDPNPTWGCAQQLASGREHTCVLYAHGRVSCFGGGSFGQLGTGDTEDSATFAAVPLEGVQSIAAGGNHTCASDGAGIYCWGDNRAAQLGIDSIEQSSTPVRTGSSQFGVVQLALGDQSGCYVDTQGHGYCWGTAEAGATLARPQQLGPIGLRPYEFVQLGGSLARLVSEERLYELPWDPLSAAAFQATPGAPAGVVENAIADDHDCVLKRAGTVWCRGEGYEPFYAVVADFGSDVVDVEVSDGFDCALTRQGVVLCRGRNDAAQLGNGTLSDTDQAKPVAGIEDAFEISLAGMYACARRSDGSVWCWGTPPGVRILTEPSLFATPPSGESCDVARRVPRPWGLPFPVATGADELSDALQGWGQNMCRCGLTDPADLEGCMAEEVRVLNGCLEALASDFDEPALCEADLAWGAATCAAACIGDSRPPVDCNLHLLGNSCGASGGVFDFCKRNSLGCDGPLSETRAVQSQICDGISDCDNGFDEANCTRAAGAFTCADGSSIAPQLVGDMSEDCPDGSDEWVL